MLELTLTILGAIFLVKIILPQILELVEDLLPQIQRIINRVKEILQDKE